MTITEKTYKWKCSLTKRSKTNYLVLHHAAASKASADDIHRIHLANSWAGIGYHFYVRKDGTVYRARPIDTVGAHTVNYNYCSVGICFEGNFEKETMPEIQKCAGQELITYLKALYPNAIVKKHKDFNATACPGKNFPFEEISKGKTKEITEISELIDALSKRGIITDPNLWAKKCNEDINVYWLVRKIANLTVNSSSCHNVSTTKDIILELSSRGVITDKYLWSNLFEEDKNLWWLGYKAANMTK